MESNNTSSIIGVAGSAPTWGGSDLTNKGLFRSFFREKEEAKTKEKKEKKNVRLDDEFILS